MPRKKKERQGCWECGRIGPHEEGCTQSPAYLHAKISDTVVAISAATGLPIEDLAYLDPETLELAKEIIDRKANA